VGLLSVLVTLRASFSLYRQILLSKRMFLCRLMALCGFLVVPHALPAQEPPATGSNAKVLTIASQDYQRDDPKAKPGDDASDEGKLPPALTHYKGRKIAPTMSYHGAPWLTRPERAKEENTAQLLKALQLKPGQAVCDIGCGNGYYTLPMARQVLPKGKVYAVDIQQEMLRLLEARAKEAELENVVPVLGTLVDPRLPKESLDLILLVDVYHEFSHPQQMLRALRDSLKPKGRLVLVEFRAEDLRVPIKPLHKMSKVQMLKELPPNGFKLVEQFDDLPWQHVMFFERAERMEGDDQPSPEDAPATSPLKADAPAEDAPATNPEAGSRPE
jgi:SAM-dependent methyltransferase